MTSTPAEPLPFPQGNPVTLPAVKSWLTLTRDGDDATLTTIVAAVNGFVLGLPVADRSRGLDAWPSEVQLGGVMLAARLYRRRNTPGGVEAVTDAGIAYVRRNDPDIAMLLQLGDEARPAVG